MPDSHFLLDPITVAWDEPPLLEKKPRCPDRFIWMERQFEIEELLGEWRDYRRRGRMASNMRPSNAYRARVRGSRGVGRFYFRCALEGGECTKSTLIAPLPGGGSSAAILARITRRP